MDTSSPGGTAAATDVVGSNEVDRRRFLASIATSALGMVALPSTRGLTGVAPQTAPPSNGPAPRRGVVLRLGNDGLPAGSVAGTYIGHDANSILLGVDAAVGVVRIRLTAQTEVCAAGHIAYGDVAACKVGDRINTGTSFTGDETRVANWIVANGLAYWAEVTALDARSMTITPYWAGQPWDPMTMVTTQHTTTYSRIENGPPVKGAGSPRSVLIQGDSIHVTCLAELPGLSHGTVWAVTIHQLDDTSS